VWPQFKNLYSSVASPQVRRAYAEHGCALCGVSLTPLNENQFYLELFVSISGNSGKIDAKVNSLEFADGTYLTNSQPLISEPVGAEFVERNGGETNLCFLISMDAKV
jgi:hypothetical protein